MGEVQVRWSELVGNGLSIRRVPFAVILEAKELLQEYAKECSIPEIGQINPRADLYTTMEKSGMFSIFGAFSGDVLVGFAALLIYVLPHYGRKIATPESLFVAKAYRSGAIGSDLMQTIEDYATQEGCAAILYSAPHGGQLERVLALREPYRRTNSTFCRSLG